MSKNLLTLLPDLTEDEKNIAYYLYLSQGIYPNWRWRPFEDYKQQPIGLYKREQILKWARTRLEGESIENRWVVAIKGLIRKIEADNEILADSAVANDAA